MYALYAEDTVTKEARKIKNLASRRFSRAMREARGEPAMRGCRMFIAITTDSTVATLHGEPSYLDAQTPQAMLRAQARAGVAAPKGVSWDD